MAASYNAAGIDERPPLIFEPVEIEGLVACAVETTVGDTQARVKEEVYPGLSGAGATYAGIVPVNITMQLTLEFATVYDLAGFEANVREYLMLGGRYQLEDELGQTWDYVELRGYRAQQLDPIIGVEDHRLRRAVLLFRWMQP